MASFGVIQSSGSSVISLAFASPDEVSSAVSVISARIFCRAELLVERKELEVCKEQTEERFESLNSSGELAWKRAS